jgi:hypothetical protein
MKILFILERCNIRKGRVLWKCIVFLCYFQWKMVEEPLMCFVWVYVYRQ